MVQHEDQVAAQFDSEMYYHAVEELSDDELVAELMDMGYDLEEGEAIDVTELILASDYVEDFGDDGSLDDEDDDSDDEDFTTDDDDSDDDDDDDDDDYPPDDIIG
jgi:segregation and condensation protein B